MFLLPTNIYQPAGFAPVVQCFVLFPTCPLSSYTYKRTRVQILLYPLSIDIHFFIYQIPKIRLCFFIFFYQIPIISLIFRFQYTNSKIRIISAEYHIPNNTILKKLFRIISVYVLTKNTLENIQKILNIFQSKIIKIHQSGIGSWTIRQIRGTCAW